MACALFDRGMEVTTVTLEYDSLEAEVRASRSLPIPLEARRLREKAGVSVTEMAHLLGVDRNTLARWETGRCLPTRQNAVRWAKAVDAIRRGIAGL